MNYLFLNTNFALKLQGKCWKDDVVTFTAHLSVTFKRLKSSFGRHVGGQEYALQHGGQYKSYYSVEKSKCHKIMSHKCVSSQISGVRSPSCGCKIILCALSIFCNIPTHCLKEALATWPLSSRGLLRNEGTAFALQTARPSQMTKIHWRSNTSAFIYFSVKLTCIKQSPALGGRGLLFRVANKFLTFTKRSLWEDVPY